jgi:hypothetical protein
MRRVLELVDIFPFEIDVGVEEVGREHVTLGLDAAAAGGQGRQAVGAAIGRASLRAAAARAALARIAGAFRGTMRGARLQGSIGRVNLLARYAAGGNDFNVRIGVLGCQRRRQF